MVAEKLAALADVDDSKFGNINMDDAAEMLNVSKNSVYRAGQVRATGVPELVARVEQGRVAVSTAAEAARAQAAGATATAQAGGTAGGPAWGGRPSLAIHNGGGIA